MQRHGHIIGSLHHRRELNPDLCPDTQTPCANRRGHQTVPWRCCYEVKRGMRMLDGEVSGLGGTRDIPRCGCALKQRSGEGDEKSMSSRRSTGPHHDCLLRRAMRVPCYEVTG